MWVEISIQTRVQRKIPLLERVMLIQALHFTDHTETMRKNDWGPASLGLPGCMRTGRGFDELEQRVTTEKIMGRRYCIILK